jgi:hypothetical protein
MMRAGMPNLTTVSQRKHAGTAFRWLTRSTSRSHLRTSSVCTCVSCTHATQSSVITIRNAHARRTLANLDQPSGVPRTVHRSDRSFFKRSHTRPTPRIPIFRGYSRHFRLDQDGILLGFVFRGASVAGHPHRAAVLSDTHVRRCQTLRRESFRLDSRSSDSVGPGAVFADLSDTLTQTQNILD